MDILPCQICGEDFTTCQCLGDDAASAESQSTTGSASGDTRSRGRHWCFTLNNPTPEEKVKLSEISQTSRGFKYMVYQIEMGLEGTPHIQGYIEFQNSVRFNHVKSLISPRIHLEKRRGTREQARQYCMKEDSRIEGPFETGTWIPDVGSGFRSDLESIRSDVKAGKSSRELWEDHFATMVRYNRAIDSYRQCISPLRDAGPVVHVLYGPPGTGKSKWCLDTFRGCYWKSQDKWWDEYESQDTVVIDEFYGWLKFSILLRICDRYPLRLERKGGFVNFTSSTIVICSNTKPRDWYPNVTNFDAFIRRVTIWHYLPTLQEHHQVATYDAFLRIID